MNVTTLRKSGRLKEAYEKARENLEKTPNEPHTVKDMGWVLYDYLKIHANGTNAQTVHKVLKAIRDLDASFLEPVLYQQVGFMIGTFLLKYRQTKHPDPEWVERIFQAVENMPFPKPSDAYSWLLKGFLAYWEEWPGFIGLMNWWGWKYLRDEDFTTEKKDDKVYSSLVEKLMGRYAKTLLSKAVHKELPGNLTERLARDLLNFMEKEERRCATYNFFSYYRAKVMALLGDKEGARACFLPFAKKKTKDFWVWDLLGELEQDGELAFACKIRGLSIKTKPEFLVKLRERMISSILERDADWARTELDRVITLKEKKGWPISLAIKEMTSQAWYAKAKHVPTEAKYAPYVTMANRCLLGKGEKVQVLIYSMIPGKQKAFGTDIHKRVYKFSGQTHDLEVGKVYVVHYQAAPNGWALVQCGEEQPLGDFASLLKVKKGKFVCREGQVFGFVKDVFIPPGLVKEHGLKNGMEVEVGAVPSYEFKKEKWALQAYTLHRE